MSNPTAILRSNLCDNNPDCPMIKLCVHKAVYYDHSFKKISINEDLCVACGSCSEHCTLFEYAFTDFEYRRIKKNILDDTRKQSDLQVDRFGADIVSNETAIGDSSWLEGINYFVKSIGGLSYVEIVIQQESECLYDCIVISDKIDINSYRKVLVYDPQKAELIRREFNFPSFPVILVFYDGQLVEKIVGVYKESTNKELLVEQIRSIQKLYGR